MRPFIAIVPLLSVLPVSYAWGELAHETIAYVAQNFVSSKTKTFCQNILKDTSTSYLANVATWADSYRETSAGAYSAPYHFIDAEDNPPSACDVNYARDCGSTGCVVQAINNYTERVHSTSLSTEQVFEALKFIIHFVGKFLNPHIPTHISGANRHKGDIHQPLHDEALDVGGNTIPVTFNHTSTNLHATWDTSIPEAYAQGYSLSNAQTWATSLTAAINTGIYKSQKAGWLTGISIDDPINTATGWATDANAYVCSTVIPNGVSAVEGVDLSGKYYQTALPVVQLLVATAGYRLAAWLNLIATGSTGL